MNKYRVIDGDTLKKNSLLQKRVFGFFWKTIDKGYSGDMHVRREKLDSANRTVEFLESIGSHPMIEAEVTDIQNPKVETLNFALKSEQVVPLQENPPPCELHNPPVKVRSGFETMTIPGGPIND